MNQPDPLSLTSVHLALHFHDQDLGVTGSGFVIQCRHGPLLVTAKHNLTGREPNGKVKHSQGALPNLVTLRNFFGPLAVKVPLYKQGNDPDTDHPAYLQHQDAAVDVVLLPLPQEVARDAANIMHQSLWHPTSHHFGIPFLRPADVCHVIGYPEGLTNELGDDHVLPIWKTGHLANDSHFKFNAQDVCLIDATTRPGQSGAPVFVVARAWNGEVAANRLVGIYTGRTSETSDLGFVWRPTVIQEIMDRAFGQWQ